MWDREVAKESSVCGRDNGKVGVVPFESTEKGVGDGIVGSEGESRWRVEIFNCGL